MDPARTETPAPTPETLRAASQAAVETVSTAYTADASIDVADRLRAEMARAGFALEDDDWVADVARSIRAGHAVTFEPEPTGSLDHEAGTEPTDPDDAVGPTSAGSLGGDNGGG